MCYLSVPNDSMNWIHFSDIWVIYKAELFISSKLDGGLVKPHGYTSLLYGEAV